MKYLSVLKFIVNYLVSIIGKLLGYIITPIVFSYRDYINNYAWNFIKQNNIKYNRSTIYKEDDEKYYTKNGFIYKRKTNKFLGYIILVPFFFIDNDANLTSCSLAFTKAEDVKGLKLIGSYFDLGDRAMENKISVNPFTNWQNFKQFYYWMVIRNGFYNYNYIVEDSYMNSTTGFTKEFPPNERIHGSNKNLKDFNEHRFYQDKSGKWFFICTLCRMYKGKAYGYEFGWRRLSNGGVNAVIRLYWSKSF